MGNVDELVVFKIPFTLVCLQNEVHKFVRKDESEFLKSMLLQKQWIDELSTENLKLRRQLSEAQKQADK